VKSGYHLGNALSVIERSRIEDSTVRPHTSLVGSTPEDYVKKNMTKVPTPSFSPFGRETAWEVEGEPREDRFMTADSNSRP
jgi:hypothetical protein